MGARCLFSRIPSGLKESIQTAVQHHIQEYAHQLDAGLSNQIELGLSESIDIILNIIEWSFEDSNSNAVTGAAVPGALTMSMYHAQLRALCS